MLRTASAFGRSFPRARQRKRQSVLLAYVTQVELKLLGGRLRRELTSRGARCELVEELLEDDSGLP